MRTFIAMLMLLPALVLAEDEERMNAEIDHILDTVAASDCLFIRNGKEHAPEAARDHLSLKRRKGKRYYDSADEFIERLASSSSWSGKPYHIRCGEQESLASDWFTAVLNEYRVQQAASGGP